LQIRFLYIVAAERDVIEKQRAQETQNPRAIPTGSSDDDRSVTSSATSREASLQRKQRDTIIARLNTPVRSFLKKSLAFAFFFVILMVPATVLSLMAIKDSDSGTNSLVKI
jgi:hypothetical protein